MPASRILSRRGRRGHGRASDTAAAGYPRRSAVSVATLLAAWLLALICIFGLPLNADAQQADQRTAQALAKAQGLLRQLGQQKAQLEADLSKLKAENAALSKKLGTAEAALDENAAELAARERQSTAVNTSLGRTEKRLIATTDKLREVIAKYKELAATLRQTQAERADLAARLAATEAELQDAEHKNLELYKANREMLKEFASESRWAALLRKEPFTGIKNVEIENIVQEYETKMQDQLRDSNLDPAGPTTPPSR